MTKLTLTAVALLFLTLTACSKSMDKPAAGTPAATETAGHTHEGWWCAEHGVPESMCALCDAKIAADYKAKGDWCAKHDRPDSQCFICHPEKEAVFAAMYEAKYNEAPPKREEEKK